MEDEMGENDFDKDRNVEGGIGENGTTCIVFERQRLK